MKFAKWMLPVTLMLLSGLMSAQSLTNSTVKAQVPFDFMVNNKIIPAGECKISAATMDGQSLLVRNTGARQSALSSSAREVSGKPAEGTVLVFKRYGNQYFLSSVRLEGGTVSYAFPQSKAEAELRAQNVPASTMTLLASLK